MSLLYRLVLLAGLVFFTANVSLAETPSYHDLPKYFKMLLGSPSQDSAEFYSVLSWVEKAEKQQASLSVLEAQKIKREVDNLIQEQLSFKNVSTFSTLLHQSGILNIFCKKASL